MANIENTEKPAHSGFEGSNYPELEDYLKQQMDAYKPETKEDREKRERREKWEGVISGISDMGMALGNLFYTSRYAPNMYDPRSGLAGKAKERFEKAKAEREKNHDRYVNYALLLGKLKDGERDFRLKLEQARQQKADGDRNFNFKVEQAAREQENWQKKFDNDNEHWQAGMDEDKRRFDVNADETRRHNRASEGIQAANVAASHKPNYTEFMLDGGEIIRVPNERLNSQNISWIAKQAGIGATKTQYDKFGRSSTVARSADDLLTEIGQNLDNPAVGDALRQLGGQRVKSNRMTMPGVE